MPAPILAVAIPVAIAAAVALAGKKKEAPAGKAVELDANLPPQRQAQALAALGQEKDPNKHEQLAQQMDVLGHPLTANALRERAQELGGATVAPAPAAAQVPLPGPAQGPAAAPVVQPAKMPPPGVMSLDEGMDADTRQAVIGMLTAESDPAKLQGFAASIKNRYPLAAGLLWQKAAALLAARPPAAPAAIPVVQQAALPPAPVVQQPAPAGYTWRLASNADVAHDGVHPRYQQLLSQPLGTQVQEMHNGRMWQLRVISHATDPNLTTYAKDVKGWVGTPAGQAPAFIAPALAPAVATPAAVIAQPQTMMVSTHVPPPGAARPIASLADVQAGLNTLNYHGADGKALKVDGKDGPNTKFAVQTFQHDHKLNADGIAGPITKTTLSAVLTQAAA